jgi:uncharacterized protein (TIGR00288 family)
MASDDERIALFLDFENLAIGARYDVESGAIDLRPIADALAERGRVVVRRAYADWTLFADARRMLTRHHVELIDIPQGMGVSRKNAADIKMAVDALELCFEREYITTFVLGTGDSDFTPLVDKLRAMNRRVIGIGMESSTSSLLAAACDEFLFFDRLEGVEAATPRARTAAARRRQPVDAASLVAAEDEGPPVARPEERDLAALVTQTLAGLERSANGPVYASGLKRTILRKDPTFNEADLGFRAFGELLRHLASRGILSLTEGAAKGDPEVSFPSGASEEEAAFALLHDVVGRSGQQPGQVLLLSGLKDRLRKEKPDFDERRFGFGSFLQFCQAARTRGIIDLEFDENSSDYGVRLARPVP